MPLSGKELRGRAHARPEPQDIACAIARLVRQRPRRPRHRAVRHCIDVRHQARSRHGDACDQRAADFGTFCASDGVPRRRLGRDFRRTSPDDERRDASGPCFHAAPCLLEAVTVFDQCACPETDDFARRHTTELMVRLCCRCRTPSRAPKRLSPTICPGTVLYAPQ